MAVIPYCGSDVFLLSFRPFSPLCDDAHAPCHRLCLNQYLLRGFRDQFTLDVSIVARP